MTVQTHLTPKTQNLEADGRWKTICFIGGSAALMIVITALSEIMITYLPGGNSSAETVTDWFKLLQSNPFMGLRNLGLLNIALTSLGIPLTFSLFWLHRKSSISLAPLALILAMIGTAIFFSTNRAFPMLDLSAQYAGTSSEIEKNILQAVGTSMLAVGQSHTPGTFLAFAFSELAGVLMALVLLQGGLFTKGAAFAGLMGFSCLLIFEVLSSFVPSTNNAVLLVALVGGLFNVAWYILAGLRLFQLGKTKRAFLNE